jgi:hypothetical protein
MQLTAKADSIQQRLRFGVPYRDGGRGGMDRGEWVRIKSKLR